MRSRYRVPGRSGRLRTIAPEQALLLLASNIGLGDDRDERLGALLDRPLRWDRVLALSDAHGVTGLMRHALRRSPGCWIRVPEPISVSLDAHHRAMRRRHLALAQQLAGVLAAAGAAGIDPIVLKGAALAATAYPDPALRPMVDIDLLIDPAETEAMGRVLAGLGYVRQAGEAPDSAFNSATGYHHLYFDPSGARVSIEVHWRPASAIQQRHALSTRLLQQRTVRARVVALPGITAARARILTPEAQIVYLATHAAQERHVFSELKLLADIAAVVAAPLPPNWETVTRLARQARARAATYVALMLARDALGVTIPPRVLAALRPPRLIRWAIERSLNAATLFEPVDEIRQAVVKYLVVDSVSVTAHLVWHTLAPSPACPPGCDPQARTMTVVAAYVRAVVTTTNRAVRKMGLWALNRPGAPGIRRVAVATRDTQGRIAGISFRAE